METAMLHCSTLRTLGRVQMTNLTETFDRVITAAGLGAMLSAMPLAGVIILVQSLHV